MPARLERKTRDDCQNVTARLAPAGSRTGEGSASVLPFLLASCASRPGNDRRAQLAGRLSRPAVRAR